MPSSVSSETLSLLHLFSGPAERPDGFASFVQEKSGKCRDVDIVNKTATDTFSHDLADDSLWLLLMDEFRKGIYNALFLGTPCTTFSAARTGPPGPRALRSPQHPYGLPKKELTIRENEEVRLGTYFALKSAEFCKMAVDTQRPFALENPKPKKGVVSLFDLPEMLAVAKMPGVRVVDFDQCPFGAETAKPTRIL